MDWVGMDCNLKKVRLTFFKFSHFRFQNALEQIIICSSFKTFQELSLGDLELKGTDLEAHQFWPKKVKNLVILSLTKKYLTFSDHETVELALYCMSPQYAQKLVIFIWRL